MDVIITAIIIGFLASFPISFVAAVLRKKREIESCNSATRVNDTTLTIQIDEVPIEGQEKLILVFDVLNGKFITQGSIDEVTEYLKTKFKTKTIFLLASDRSTLTLLKPAELQ